jgi:hypothetical protein
MADKEVHELADGGAAQAGDRTHAVRGGSSRGVTLGGGAGLNLASQAEAEAGTATDKLMSPLLVAQLLAAAGLAVESGSWTPTLLGSSSNPSVTYAGARSGQFLRIGNLVHVWGNLEWTSASGGSGNTLIGGLPFSVMFDAAVALGSRQFATTGWAGWDVMLLARNGTATIEARSGEDSASNQIALSHFTGGAGHFVFSGAYRRAT